ncbi:MAG: uracil phosphoribosyltransferase [Oscillospiraceae bacterium]|nr:uracil phosphoribosyltransferase [Oscillospiraceae bacterium]MCI7499826.1 uracil phosphoribosyltransferase [Oscillospiraceae bacterium]MDD7279845.1 uracil phosphoribosyltransferase [Oscillospiraceae bacterium]MDY2864968.1 uracil phosphoribosyltransferase [Oscillospiraceae bacterium]
MSELKYTIIDHPLVQHKLSLMRDVTTGSKEFRELVSETSMLMCYEAMRDLPVKTVDIQTPLGIAKSKVISGRKLAYVPILRAGLGMVDGVMNLIPAAKVGHIGTFRDPETTDTVEYYCKLPKDIASRDVIIADIMLATGGAACEAVNLVKKAGAKNVKFMCIIANERGIKQVNETHPDVQIYTAAVDPELNEQLYIVPGLGDAGDRMYGTK